MQRVRECFAKGRRFALTTHVNPDGDGLGCEAALAAFLSQMGKEVFVFNSNPVPSNYQFLDPDGKILEYDRDRHHEILLSVDFVIILDISDWYRLRQVGIDTREGRLKRICIDHHPNDKAFGDITLLDTTASSTGEIVYQLIEYCEGEFTSSMAEALYTSIMTDTGSFRFSNTKANSFAIANELVKKGVRPHLVYQQVYERQTRGKIKLFAYVLNNISFVAGGKIAWFKLSHKTIADFGAVASDTEGFADYPRVVEGVEISVMFVEMESGRTKVSLRSKGNHVINKIAQKFGGGGHAYAAGVLLDGNPEEYIGEILKELTALIRGET